MKKSPLDALDGRAIAARELEDLTTDERSQRLLNQWEAFYRRHPHAASSILRLADEYGVSHDAAMSLASIGIQVERAGSVFDGLETAFLTADESQLR